MINIRKATLDDIGDITEIYNEAILNTIATFDTKPKTVEEQIIWFKERSDKNPILVVEKNGTIVGWASLSKWSDKSAYSDTAEISLYIFKKHQGQGIGRKLFRAILHEGQKVGLHAVITMITVGNEKSVHLHESEGFFNIGVMKEVGYKFGKRLDVILMQKIYGNSSDKIN